MNRAPLRSSGSWQACIKRRRLEIGVWKLSLPQPQRRRPGATLIELLIFIAVLALVGVAVMPLLFATAEDRLLQQTVSIVEQNGAQILQTITYRVRHAEKILDPSISSTGSILAVQTGSGSTDPTIFGISSGALVIIHRTAKEIVSSTQVAVQDLVVRNTSQSATRQSVFVQFKVSRTIRLQAPRSYLRTFEALITLHPDDEREGNACACAVPGCAGGNVYAWQVCEEGACLTAQTPLECP